MIYRGYEIVCRPKPIPADCGVDWDWYPVDYDGPEAYRGGVASSEDGAKAYVDDELEDLS